VRRLDAVGAVVREAGRLNLTNVALARPASIAARSSATNPAKSPSFEGKSRSVM
jgi:hypothetical protein